MTTRLRWIPLALLAVSACGGQPEVGPSTLEPSGAGGSDAGAAGSAEAGTGSAGAPSELVFETGGTSSESGAGGAATNPCLAHPGATGCAPPECGDGVISGKEQCDDGDAEGGDGCSANCALESGFHCDKAGEACRSTIECGDGQLGGTEACDDHNIEGSDGCSDSCTPETGWKCPTVGTACVAAECGDRIVAGAESCDDGNQSDSDGCSAACTLEQGFACPTPGSACSPTLCGDEIAEGTEQCDDGNFDTGDGCSPLCTFEPTCKEGTCVPRCGDGLKLDSEACDDGNTTAGDGCSATCEIEEGFTCKVVIEDPKLPIVYRDFIGTDGTGSDDPLPENLGPVHLDFQKYYSCTESVEKTLDTAGKPVLATGIGDCVESAESFATWYRSDPALNRTVVDTLPLSLVAGTENTFEFYDEAFFPLTGRGWNDPLDLQEETREDSAGDPQNFHFTSELRYWFTYRGGEKLTFYGDDDVWVFINGHLAVNIPGVHGRLQRAIQLPGPDGDPAGNTSGGGGTTGEFDPTVLGLTLGGIYEVVVYQAERRTVKSQYKLTLENFLSARSRCDWTCGDGITTRFEVCDDGKNDGSYGSCAPGCMAYGPRCGDNVVDKEAGEKCDDGINRSPYNGCGPNCQPAPTCGDGNVDSLFQETCDDGADKNTGEYGACGPNCRRIAFCGDKVQQAGEECDDGNGHNGDGCNAECRVELIQ